jgi:hypothetical protein
MSVLHCFDCRSHLPQRIWSVKEETKGHDRNQEKCEHLDRQYLPSPPQSWKVKEAQQILWNQTWVYTSAVFAWEIWPGIYLGASEDSMIYDTFALWVAQDGHLSGPASSAICPRDLDRMLIAIWQNMLVLLTMTGYGLTLHNACFLLWFIFSGNLSGFSNALVCNKLELKQNKMKIGSSHKECERHWLYPGGSFLCKVPKLFLRAFAIALGTEHGRVPIYCSCPGICHSSSF